MFISIKWGLVFNKVTKHDCHITENYWQVVNKLLFLRYVEAEKHIRYKAKLSLKQNIMLLNIRTGITQFCQRI